MNKTNQEVKREQVARSTSSAEAKLAKLAEIEGMTEMEMLEAATFDSVAHSICKNPGCDYTTSMEPDQDQGWCEECQEGSVVSCLVLAGIL